MRKARILQIAAIGALTLAAPSLAQRSAQEILTEYDQVTMPTDDREKAEAPEYLKEFYKQRTDAFNAQADLIAELFKSHPNHEQIPTLMPVRWRALLNSGKADEITEETNAIIASGKYEAINLDAAFWHAQTIGRTSTKTNESVVASIDRFIKLAPADDKRPGRLLMSAAARSIQDDPDLQLILYKRVLKDYPKDSSAKYAGGKIKQIEDLGKPFELAFNEATSSETISMKDLRGKVVVIDFWATWCGPCVAEMPHMKKLYTAYNEKGVEFVGISLDQPENKDGLIDLLAYVKENEVTWPQYYQGDGWASEFSSSWGINSIPALFVVDQKGNLHSVKARGQLEKMIPELLGIDPVEIAQDDEES